VVPEHVVVVDQLPVLSQVWAALPMQRVWLGAQTPVQLFM
jgi:hypothetical protein